MLYVLCIILGALLGVGIMCLVHINKELTPPPIDAPAAAAKEESHAAPAYRYDPITRKPTRRLP